MNTMNYSYRIGYIIVESLNDYTKLSLVPFPDGKGLENNPFDFHKIHKTVPLEYISITTKTEGDINDWEIYVPSVGSIKLTKCEKTHIVEGWFNAAGSPVHVPIKMFMRDDICVIHENGREWVFNDDIGDWKLVSINPYEK